MDYNQLLSLAQSKTKITSNSIKKSKSKPSGPDPKAIEKFLINKRLKEIHDEEEKRAKLAKLLSLRKQNSKSNKKAKLMANRTKDNDYSKIVLTDRDIENKKRIDAELKKKGINDKLDRMKERIELDHELEDQPIKRKRKPRSVVEDPLINYSYEKIKKNSEKILKRSESSQQAKIQQSKSAPPSYEDLLKLAEQQRGEKKTLEQEIEEELLIKKNKNDMSDVRKKEELYQKSLSGLKKKKNDTKSIQPSALKQNINKHDDYHENQPRVSSNMMKSTSKKPNPEFGSAKNERSFCRQSPKRNDLPPISQIIKRQSQDNKRESSNGLERILDDKTPGNLATKIANLSKEELLELANAVKKVKESKKNFNEEYSPRKYQNYNEYKPRDYLSEKQSSHKINSAPVYVPTRIKAERHEDEHYCPVNNYKATDSSLKKQTTKSSQSMNSKLFDIDSLTLEEIEKIKQERIAKQKREEAATKLSNERSKSSKQIEHSSIAFDRESNKPSTSKISSTRKIYSANHYLPPIGKNYRRGDYDTNYDNYDEEYDEEDDMSDFIDDGNDFGTQEDVSRAIEELFPKYKKRKYQIFDDDSDIEESSYAQQMKEELHSSHIGLLEDLAEERREQEELRRKRRRKGIISSDEED